MMTNEETGAAMWLLKVIDRPFHCSLVSRFVSLASQASKGKGPRELLEIRRHLEMVPTHILHVGRRNG